MKKPRRIAYLLLWLIGSTFCYAISAPSTFTVTAVPSSGELSDISVVRNRYRQSVLPTEPNAIRSMHELSSKYAASLDDEGSWADIKYSASSRAGWTPVDHLQRLLVMAKSACLFRNLGQPDPRLEDKIHIALKWWTDHDYRNPNWWWNDIGVPELMGEIGNLMWPYLSSDDIQRLDLILKRSDWRSGGWTGANLTWGTGIEIARGCLEDNAKMVADGFERMFEEIRIIPQQLEGIQQDYSFHQHGPQLYNGGYGLTFANDVGRFISYSWGTRYQVPKERMEIYISYLLDGEQWFIRGGDPDYSALSRVITRQEEMADSENQLGGPISPVGLEYGLGHILALLAAEPVPRQQELRAFADRIRGLSDAPEFIGNKQFWCSDYMSHRGRGYFASVKMLSTRTLNAELVNSEGKKSVHLSDGANFLYLSGDEYTNVFPVWDWTKIPGTTAIQGTLQTGEPNPISMHGVTAFDGGVSDGTYGMAAMDLARGELVAKKAWFFFDKSYVALGAGITVKGDTEHSVATDVNQSLLIGRVLTGEAKKPVLGDTRVYDTSKPVWVYHNHIGYIFPPNTTISLSVGPQIGSWAQIGAGSSDPITMQVFNLWIEHGRIPKERSYQYIVVPNVSAEAVAKESRNSTLDVLSNTTAIQAVYSKSLKLAEIAFRAAGSLPTPLGNVTTDHACLLMVRQVDSKWMLTASNPRNEALMLTVTVNGRQSTINLPGGSMAGSSVTNEVR